MTDGTMVQTEVGVGVTEEGGSGTARAVVESEEEEGGIDRTEVQTGVGVGGTEVEGNGTAQTVVACVSGRGD